MYAHICFYVCAFSVYVRVHAHVHMWYLCAYIHTHVCANMVCACMCMQLMNFGICCYQITQVARSSALVSTPFCPSWNTSHTAKVEDMVTASGIRRPSSMGRGEQAELGDPLSHFPVFCFLVTQ